MESIRLCEISKSYRLGGIDAPVLGGVSFSVSSGEFVALMGPSGSGKTTLMNILGCLDQPSSGRYFLEDDDVGALSNDRKALLRNRKIGFVFQNFNLLPRTSALENVMMPLTYSVRPVPSREARRRAQALLERVGLGDRLHNEPAQLSGGQQQRVAIARALVRRPSILLADEPTGNLDSETSEEVLRLLRDLNEEEGVTIVLVTHDEYIARHARRTIRIRDGAVEADESRAGLRPASPAGRSSEDFDAGGAAGSGGSFSRGRRLLLSALNGLRRNIMRSSLTALGIVIGIAAVIAMMEIGRGSSKAIQLAVSSMGAGNLLIHPGAAASGGVSHGAGTAASLTPQDAEAIVKECPAVIAAAPTVHARTQVVYGNRNWVPIFIYGTTPEYLAVGGWRLAEGEPFTERDVRNGSKVCILGQRLVKELFQGDPPIGAQVRIKNVPFVVIGVLEAKGANMMGLDQDDILLAPWTAIKHRVAGASVGQVNQSAASATSSSDKVNSLNSLYPAAQSLYPEASTTQAADTPLLVRFPSIDHILVTSRTQEQTPAAIAQITQLLRERHRTTDEDPDDFHIRDMTEITNALSSTATVMTDLLLAVALISLVVGGVGIMNIMLVSVTERTREIGLRMAVGAPRGAILRQFLLESVALCLFGGAGGIAVGRGVSHLVSVLLGWPTEFSPDAILAAFAVSTVIGVAFGYYPAWKASRMDPIRALRYE